MKGWIPHGGNDVVCGKLVASTLRANESRSVRSEILSESIRSNANSSRLFKTLLKHILKKMELIGLFWFVLHINKEIEEKTL